MAISINGSTLTFSDSTTQTTAAVIAVSCVAWCKANCVTTVPTVVASYNIASVTRLSTATYSFQFTNALASADYAAVFTSSSTGTGAGLAGMPSNRAITANEFDRVVCRDVGNTSVGTVDRPPVLYAAFFL